MNKKGFEFSFGWMFAIVVGAAVLFLAIYASSRFITTEKQASNAVAGETLSALLSPVETGIESGKASQINTNTLTKIYLGCDRSGTFGSQEISMSLSSGLGNKWEKPYTTAEFQNKYIFSGKEVQGKVFYLLSVPFNYPFKVADMMVVFSEQDKYCLVKAPDDVIRTLNSTALSTIQLANTKADCSANSRKVCFADSGCDIDVSLKTGSVRKNSTTLYYEPDSFGESLLYGAIFSDPEIYECQASRLAKRISVLADVYENKESLLAGSSCNSNLGAFLETLKSGAKEVTDSGDLEQLGTAAREVDDQNEGQNCRLY